MLYKPAWFIYFSVPVEEKTHVAVLSLFAPISRTRYRDFVQAFSHFTYEATQGSLLVCDLQGVFMAKQPFAESSRPGLDLPHGAKQLDSQDGSNSGEWVPTFRLTVRSTFLLSYLVRFLLVSR